MTLAASARTPWLAGRRFVAIGSRRAPSYSLMLYLGCVAGLVTSASLAPDTGIEPVRFTMATAVLLLSALLGARLWFVVQHPAMFRGDLRRVLRPGDGGAGLYGGLVLAVPLSLVVLPVFDLLFSTFWDLSTFTMLVGLVLTRFGCLMNGCCAGRATTSAIGVWLPDERGVWVRRVPTQMLEAAWGALVLAAALLWHDHAPFPGALFLTVVGFYAAVRVPLGRLRAQAYWQTGDRVLSILLAIACLALLISWPWRFAR